MVYAEKNNRATPPTNFDANANTNATLHTYKSTRKTSVYKTNARDFELYKNHNS